MRAAAAAGGNRAVSVADEMSGFCSRRSVRFWRVSKPGDRDATRGTDGKVFGGAGALSGCGVVDNAARSPQLHRAIIISRSGHLMCYENRTSSRATDTPENMLGGVQANSDNRHRTAPLLDFAQSQPGTFDAVGGRPPQHEHRPVRVRQTAVFMDSGFRPLGGPGMTPMLAPMGFRWDDDVEGGYIEETPEAGHLSAGIHDQHLQAGDPQ